MAIVALLLICLLSFGVLGWQSWILQKSNAATVESVLREYAMLAADEYSRRSIAAIGYRGYYQVVSRFDESGSAGAMLQKIKQDADIGEAADLVDGFFVYDESGLSTAGLEMSAELGALLQEQFGRVGELEGPYHSVRTASGLQQIVFSTSMSGDGHRRLAGFTVAEQSISRVLKNAFETRPLLPPSLASGRLGNDLLFVRFSNPAGQTMFQTNPQYDSNLTISKLVGNDYQGVLEDFAIDISVDPRSASDLIIGGLPESRMPLLLGVMVMTVLMMLSAIWLYRREHAVMLLRSEFVSQVSHELRTPLTQIRMFAETLLLGRTRSEDERRRSLEIIDRESRRLSQLVDNILRFSNISDTTNIDRQWQALAPVVQEVCDTMRLTGNGTVIRLSVDDSVWANIDADALRQIVLNLLDNAIKFGPDDQEIEVSVSGDESVAIISVADQGPGIPENERERVWSAFYRMKREEAAAISGTGIGLSVVRELVEAMQGHCWIDAQNGGTRVNMEFQTGESDIRA